MMKITIAFLSVVFFSLFVIDTSVVQSQPFCPGDGEIINGSLDAVNGPFQTGRIFRDSIPSECIPPKAFPGNVPAEANNFNVHEFGFAAEDSCVTVNYDVGTCGNVSFATAYMNSYNPLDISENYLGDMGGSFEPSFEFVLPSGNQLVLVVSSVLGPRTCDYSFSIENFDCVVAPPGVTNVPTLSEWGLIAMAGILGIVGFMVIRRRKVTA